MRAFASRTTVARRSSTEPSPGRAWLSVNVSTTIVDATSPARAPPIPSATANSGACSKTRSSLLRRWRPVSDLAKLSWATRSITRPSLYEREFVVANPDAVSGVQGLWSFEQVAVEVGAVGRVQILYHQHVSLPENPAMARGGERILKTDLRRVPAAEHRSLAQVVLVARAHPHRLLHPQTRLGLLERVGRQAGDGRVHSGGV